MDSEYYEDLDNYDGEYASTIRWPRHMGSFPPIITTNYPPLCKPAAVDPGILSSHAAYESAAKESQKSVDTIDIEITKIIDKLKTIDASSSGVKRWSSRVDHTKQKRRLEDELKVLQNKKTSLRSVYDKALHDGRHVRSLVEGHEESNKLYTDHMNDKRELWKYVYGDEIPVKSVKGVRENIGGGLVRIHVGEEVDIDSVYRCLKLGGHHYVRTMDSNLERWVEVEEGVELIEGD